MGDHVEKSGGRFMTPVLLAVTLIAYPALRYGPASDEIESTRSEAAEALGAAPRTQGRIKDMTDVAQLEGDYDELQDRIRAAQADVEALRSWFSPVGNRQAMRVVLSELAHECDVSIVESTSDAADSSYDVVRIPIDEAGNVCSVENLLIHGDYGCLIRFLSRLESHAPRTVVTRFEMKPTKDNGADLETRIALLF